MKLAQLVEVLEAIAPPHFAERWDNVGLLVGDPDADISRALLAIDYTLEVADEGRRAGCDVVIAYHPPIFDGLKRVLAGSAVYDAIRRGVAIYSLHTALDVADGGTNDMLADVLELSARAPLRFTGVRPDGQAEAMGMGRVGEVAGLGRELLFDRIKTGLELDHLLVAGPLSGPVHRAAVGAGSCGDLVNDAIAARADLYLTGELRHHDALKAAKAGMTVVCTGHSNSERAVLKRVAKRVAARLPGLELRLSVEDRDPFRVR